MNVNSKRYYEASFGPGVDAGPSVSYTVPETIVVSLWVALAFTITRVLGGGVVVRVFNKAGQLRALFPSANGAGAGVTTNFAFGAFGNEAATGAPLSAQSGMVPTNFRLKGGDVITIVQDAAAAGDSIGAALLSLLVETEEFGAV